MTPPRRATDLQSQARDLRVALETLADALARGDAAAVLAHEPVLQAVAGAVVAPSLSSEQDRLAAADDLARGRAALARCRALAAAHAEVTGVTLDILGRSAPYGRHGAGTPRQARGHDLHARV